MAKHTEIGRNGEQIAVNFLKNKGYVIKALNWRHGHEEIDIIAMYGHELVFAEVKTRRSLSQGFPEEAVHGVKKAAIKKTAAAYLEQQGLELLIRFDIISILLQEGREPEILHLQDAFY